MEQFQATEFMTPNEVSALLRVSKTSVYRMVENRVIVFYRIRGQLRFKRSDINHFIDGQCQPAISPPPRL
jgi:excisionase family DNA binding protein